MYVCVYVCVLQVTIKHFLRSWEVQGARLSNVQGGFELWV